MYEIDEIKYLWLLGIVPVLVLVFLFNLYWKRKKQREFGDIALVRKLSPEQSLFKHILKFTVVVLALASLIIALANPRIGTKMETVKREGIDIVFAIDVSKSMLCEDVSPNRLEKSKQMVSQIINSLAGDRVGIVVYAGSAFKILPITSDYGAAKMYLQSISTGMVSSQGTALDDAIKMSTEFFDKDSKTSKLIVMLSDGEDHSEGAEDAAEEAKKAGVKIITIGLGTAKGGPIPLRKNGTVQGFQRDRSDEVVVTKLNKESLKTIGESAGGGYVYGGSSKEVTEYLRKSLEKIEKTEFESTQMANFESQFQWFLGIAMALLLLDVFFLERKTAWLQKLNLFNEKTS
ncbi:VWFA domain-containing protein [Flavobacterium longum]|uniref:vWA domain-containing protein n=1 Tax=Flavobacterium longum TaxID=1299340 RepID=UPI0039ECDBA9